MGGLHDGRPQCPQAHTDAAHTGSVRYILRVSDALTDVILTTILQGSPAISYPSHT